MSKSKPQPPKSTPLDRLTTTGITKLTQEPLFLDALQFVEPIWQHTRTWSKRGCLVLAEAVQFFLTSHEVPCQVTTVYGTWDEDPLHAVVMIGEQQILDHEGRQNAANVLEDWEAYIRGGAIFNPLDASTLQQYGFPVDHELSKTMAAFLEAAFQEA